MNIPFPGKWYNSLPVYSAQSNSRSFMCPECLPICNYVVYTVQSTSGFIAPVNLGVQTYEGIRE